MNLLKRTMYLRNVMMNREWNRYWNWNFVDVTPTLLACTRYDDPMALLLSSCRDTTGKDGNRRDDQAN